MAIEDFKKYPIKIQFIEDFYFAFLPDFGYSACSATGYTIEDAVKLLQKVYEVVVKYYIDTGKIIPAPTTFKFF